MIRRGRAGLCSAVHLEHYPAFAISVRTYSSWTPLRRTVREAPEGAPKGTCTRRKSDDRGREVRTYEFDRKRLEIAFGLLPRAVWLHAGSSGARLQGAGP
jgi:hypothetical protein